MEGKKVKVVFEFDRKDYEHILFLIDSEQAKDKEKVWETMINEDVVVSKEVLSKAFQISQKEVLAMFVSIAVMCTQNNINSVK